MDKTISNPNDLKVVRFVNIASFDFTPELGCMFDSRPLFVAKGEVREFPYHVGNKLATNLAKAMLMSDAPSTDVQNDQKNPIGTPLWAEKSVENLKSQILTELYLESKPIAMSETDRLIAKVAELEQLFKEKNPTPVDVPTSSTYKDKQEVIAELTKRGIKFNVRQNKENLEKLLA